MKLSLLATVLQSVLQSVFQPVFKSAQGLSAPWKVGLLSLVGCVGLWGFVWLRLEIARHRSPRPQAILALGGGIERETRAAYLAKTYPQMSLWVSSGSPPERLQALFRDMKLPEGQTNLDYRATDTVTNFTTLVEDFQRQGIQHIYVVTSEGHMERATAIATLVLGSRGIAFTPITVQPPQPYRESPLRISRDLARSVLWLFTGRTGARFHPRRRQLGLVGQSRRLACYSSSPFPRG